jgi:hypothetical protein
MSGTVVVRAGFFAIGKPVSASCVSSTPVTCGALVATSPNNFARPVEAALIACFRPGPTMSIAARNDVTPALIWAGVGTSEDCDFWQVAGHRFTQVGQVIRRVIAESTI